MSKKSKQSYKKASLDLSVNAIVVMVIAFIVLGLILTFSRNVFDWGNNVFRQVPTPKFEAASSDNPIIPTLINLKAGGVGASLNVELYNKDSREIKDVLFKFSSCIGAVGTFVGVPEVRVNKIPSIAPSATGKTIALVNTVIPSGTYSCTLSATSVDGATVFETVSVEVKVES